MFLLFVAAGMGLMVLAHVAPFPFLLDALTPGSAHWDMPPREGAPRVYLTYDDGPNPTATPALLDVLAREGASCHVLRARSPPRWRHGTDRGAHVR